MMRGCRRWYRKWHRFISKPASTPQYMRGAVARVRPNVTMAIKDSTRDTRQSRVMEEGLMRLNTAVTTIAASAEVGT